MGSRRGMGERKKVNLALQGGGSHGAFTWGVLDYLLEDGRLDIAAVSGTSAGAMNAVVMAEGWLENGRDGARENLRRFWRSISTENALSPFQAKFFDLFLGPQTLGGQFSALWGDFLLHFASPYQFNPFNVNPLKKYLVDTIDFEKVRAFKEFKLFIAATNVKTGKIKVFNNPELTADHVMASATLPTLFQTVEIDGEPYWDGGYMGNPALFPFFYHSGVPDIIIIQVNPIERAAVPHSTRDIQNRLDEITFNGALMGELRAIDFVVRLIDAGKLSAEEYTRPLVHRIDGGDLLRPFNAATKSDASWQLISSFFEFGRTSAEEWLDENYDRIGKEGTLNLRMAYS
jgi:NTE family protein